MAEIIQDSESVLNHPTFPAPPQRTNSHFGSVQPPSSQIKGLPALRADSPRRKEFELKHMD